MKVDTKQIEWLLKNATGYQIAKISGIPQPTISALVIGKRKVKNLTIVTGYRLTEAAYTLKASEENEKD